MFKFVVLCAFVAAASGNPSAFLAPLSYSTNVAVPSPAVYSSHPSSYIYSPSYVPTGPLAYSSPYGYSHFIKKRSALNSYIAPTTYLSSAPLYNSWTGASYAAPLATTYAGPLATSYAGPLAATYSSPLYTTAHLIKKRSAQYIVPSTYVAPAAHYAAAPYVASTYAAAGPYVSTPYVSTAPFGYSHFIKKRSAPLAIATYGAPASYSHQSRFDYQATSPAISTYSTYSSPLVYPSALGLPHYI
ncbi:jg25326 [Pararge aegeria aegeria]|uniref:Jg25326 protein n=1 Tax=Pararge aegeria aegeria TaxID=348720 RepID=A0A8S4S2H0_9NEOP|nr:jg25326 [Pararge aegeria aegeria]